MYISLHKSYSFYYFVLKNVWVFSKYEAYVTLIHQSPHTLFSMATRITPTRIKRTSFSVFINKDALLTITEQRRDASEERMRVAVEIKRRRLHYEDQRVIGDQRGPSGTTLLSGNNRRRAHRLQITISWEESAEVRDPQRRVAPRDTGNFMTINISGFISCLTRYY